MKLYALFLTAVLLLASCSSSVGVIAPVDIDVPLPIGTPEAVGIDSFYLNNMARQIDEKDEHKMHSILVVRHGKLVFESYYNGFTRVNPHDLRSTTKSITSLLTGIALEEGALADLDAPMMTYLRDSYPEVADKDAITIRHLLTMSAGLDCHDQDRGTKGQEDRMYRSKDWVQYFLSLDPMTAPGDTTLYCTGGVVALGEAIAQATGEDFAAFADRALFAPLGIKNYQWARFDNDKKVDSGGHLLLTPQGMAKIGILVLQDGRWQDKQVVPSDWIRTSTRVHTHYDDNPYGFLWWPLPLRYRDKTVETITARGNGGQVIFIVPEYALVAVFTAGYYNSDLTRIPYELFYHAILPSVKEANLTNSN